MANRTPRAAAGSYPKKYNKREIKVLEAAQESRRKDVYEEFREAPIAWTAASLIGYGDPTGTTGDVNMLKFEQTEFEYHIKGTQTILAPKWVAASGLDIAMDNTNDDGVELTNGITSRSKRAFTVGSEPFGFYAECTITLADVSGTDDCAFGFRKAEAYQAAIDSYDEMACLNIISGSIKAETILNDAATVTSATLGTVADLTAVTLRVEVGTSGLTKFFIDGVQAEASFQFDSGEVVVPFLYFLHAADVCNTAYLTKWRVGYL